MDVQQSETGHFDANELVRLLPEYLYHYLGAKNFQSFSNDFQDLKIQDVSQKTEEMSLIDLIKRDDKEQLVCRSTRLFEEALNQDSKKAINQDFDDKENRQPNITRSIYANALRSLHLCCKYDSVECAKCLIEGEVGEGLKVNEIDESGRTALHSAAEMHAERCIALLLSKKARTDIRSSDGNSHLPLETALSSTKMSIRWTAAADTVEDLLVLISGMELSAVRMLVENTKGIAEVAYASAMEGRVVALAVLLSLAPEKVTASIKVLRPDSASSSKEATTIYECVIREALSLGQKESSRGARRLALSNSEKRRLLLCEIELLQLFDATIHERGCTDQRVVSPLIRASQAGDEEVIELLLKANIDINETDGEGNSALHWYLRTSSNTKKPRTLLLLLKHGVAVRQRNRLGLTPLHLAAAKGYYQALQILLLQDPECVDAVSEMSETPLFFAVKNDFMNCAKLLLRHGANTQLLNLRKQRPIDLAKSQDMRFLLSQMCIRFWSGADSIRQEISPSYSSKDDQSDSYGEMYAFIKAQLDSSPSNDQRFSYAGAKTQICKYFESPGGCARGTKCYYAHGEEELSLSSGSSGNSKQQLGYEVMMMKQGGRQTPRSPTTEELKRKIFIGGLPPSVDSGTLRELFDHQFGSVEEAIVIGNQAGNHVPSRGFGFVTFKREESVTAAVHAHYVMISGKKVEIKGAIPKPKSQAEPSKPTSRQLQYNLTTLSPNGPRHKAENRKLEPTSWLDRLFGSTTQDSQIVNLDSTSSDNLNVPRWVYTFKKWLPGFLHDVSKRLKEGEWYPLSSLKGDFRATCGLELDHASLGYIKLSDFMRSFPGICRMKVVPVGGRGPATHMVLLPNIPSSPFHQNPHHQLIPITSVDSNNINPPLLDENDSDEDLRLIEGLILAANFGCASGDQQGTSSGSGRKEGNNNAGDGVDYQRLLEFTRPSPDGRWPPWPRRDSESGGDDDNTRNHVVLQALSNEKDFSFFVRQYDFHKTYRERLEKKICFRCNRNRMLWYSKPCGEKLWCTPCKSWVVGRINDAVRRNCKSSEIKCVSCDVELNGHGFQVWRDQLNQQQPIGPNSNNNNNNPLVDIVLNNEEDFPPLE